MCLLIMTNNDPLDIYMCTFRLLVQNVYGVLLYTTKNIIFEYIDTIDEFPVPDLILKLYDYSTLL